MMYFFGCGRQRVSPRLPMGCPPLLRDGDYLGMMAGALILFGLGGIYAVHAAEANACYFLLRQFLWAVVAGVVAWGAARIPFEWYLKTAFWWCAAALLALALVTLSAMPVNGMRGWFHLTGSVMLQPSELAKPLLVLGMIGCYRRWGIKKENYKKVGSWRCWGAMFGLWAGFTALVLLQPDFGTGMVYLGTGVLVLFLSGAPLRLLGALAGMAILGGGAIICRYGYMQTRLVNFFDRSLDPTGGAWHLRQFELCVSRGHWLGAYANSTGEESLWARNFLPLSHNDSIFAALSECLGAAGMLVMVFCFAVFFYHIFRMGVRAGRQQQWTVQLVIDALGGMLLLQTLLHVGVNLALLPPTGVTLPFVSYGGSSLVGSLFAVGILLSAERSLNTAVDAISVDLPERNV